MDTILIVILALPFILLYTVSLARRGRHLAHRRWQTSLFFLVLVAVILFEIDIRLTGGSGSLIRESSFADKMWFKLLLYSHISVSVLTFSLWGGSLMYSSKLFRLGKLPGLSSVQHKTLGIGIFIGTCLTAASGLTVYLYGFVF